MFDARSRPLQHAVTAAALVFGLWAGGAAAQSSGGPSGAVMQAYQELFSVSQKEKRGLMFFVRGQQIGGAVTKVMGNDAVEIRNQTYGRIVIRIEHIDAVAIN
jgi:hypothetical protein